MSRYLMVAAFLTPIFSQTAANAEQVSAFAFGTIYNECSKGSALCLGYVTGVGEIMALSHDAKWGICAGGAVPSSAAMVRAVLTFGQAHPEYQQAPSPAAVAVALKTVWPCK